MSVLVCECPHPDTRSSIARGDGGLYRGSCVRCRRLIVDGALPFPSAGSEGGSSSLPSDPTL